MSGFEELVTVGKLCLYCYDLFTLNTVVFVKLTKTRYKLYSKENIKLYSTGIIVLLLPSYL